MCETAGDVQEREGILHKPAGGTAVGTKRMAEMCCKSCKRNGYVSDFFTLAAV